ncbi:S6 family peptidase [Pantoea sp. NSTU24]
MGANGGDSGSPVFAWDDSDQQWKLVGVHVGYDADEGLYRKRAAVGYMPGDFITSVQSGNASPDVADVADKGPILWDESGITQGGSSWSWTGLGESYASVLPSAASDKELDATKDLRFNGAGNLITLDSAINMGAGKLRFSNNYTVSPLTNVNATWVGGGVEVDAGKEVLWQVNGLAGDALHKIGEGTLHVNARGVNPGALNVGEGTVILDQRTDDSGKKQAFSSVTLVSGRPTVILDDENQVPTDQIFFGYRGGKLDLNGTTLDFKKINHTDSGARLINSSQNPSTLNLNGFQAKDIPINKLNSDDRNGTPGSIYIYKKNNNPAEYFQLKKSRYVYFPRSKTSTSDWQYLGTDLNQAINYRLSQLDTNVFRGFLGETRENAFNGVMNVNIRNPGTSAITALTGGMNLNGDLNVSDGTTVLSGQPVAHAGGVVIDDDWNTSLFKARQINVGSGAHFQVGEYAGVNADIVAADSATLSFGYNDSQLAAEKSWRCYAVINSDNVSCTQPVRSTETLAALPASEVNGNVQLANQSSLYLGKVNYQGAVISTGNSAMTLGSDANWTMTDNSNVTSVMAQRGSRLSMVPDGSWHAKTLHVDTLNATGMNLLLGVKPSTLESDKLIIRESANGGDNLLDVSLLMNKKEPVSLSQDLVMVDAPTGTSASYFTFASNYSGFSVYTPNYQVKENNDRVQWVLKSNHSSESLPETDATASEPASVPEETSAPESAPVSEVTTASEPTSASETISAPESAPATDSVSASSEGQAVSQEVSSDTAKDKTATEARMQDSAKTEEKPKASKSAVGETEKAEADARSVVAFNPDDWFTVHDNQPLIQHTRALLASRQYIFSEAVSQLHNRIGSLRMSPERSGSWATIEQRNGHFMGLNARQQTLNAGWDMHSDTQTAGISASYTQGKVKGEGQEKHWLATAGAYYSWQSESGWFIDTASRYMYLNQTLSLDPGLNINRSNQESQMLAGSLRSGYQFRMADDTLSISPYVGVSGGVISGYSLKGKDAEVSLSSSAPYFTTTGILAQKRGLGSALLGVNLSASLEYQYSPGKNGSTTSLSDRQSTRQYSAWSDNRYRSSVSLQGVISPDLSLVAKVDTSFGGEFKTDYSGQVGFAWHF